MDSRFRFRSASPVAMQRYALLLVMFSTAVAFFNAGMSWMTHMHHEGLRYVNPAQLVAYDESYEQLTSVLVVPLNAVSVLCVATMIVLRPRGVPWWMLATAVALQATVWVVRTTLWGPLAEATREAGWVLRGGVLEPSYEEYMSTNWIRIALLSAYALLVLAMLVVARLRTSLLDRTLAGLAR